MNQYGRAYQDTIDTIYFLGRRVMHYPGIKRYGASIHHDTKWIIVRKEYKNTLWGCYALAHELGHLVDALNGKYKRTFQHDENNFLPLGLIRESEWSAVQFAKKWLKSYDFNLKNIKEICRSYFEEEGMPYWATRYNNLSVKDYLECYEEAKKYQYRTARNRRKSGRSRG